MNRFLIAIILFTSIYCNAQNKFQVSVPESERIFKLEQPTDKKSQANKKDKTKQSKVDEIAFFVRMPESWTEEKAKIAKNEGRYGVRGVLAICTFTKSQNSMKSYLLSGGSNFDHFVKLADENDLALVTWTNFRGYEKGLSSDEMLSGQFKEYEKNFLDRLSEWERGFKRLLAYYNLPGDSVMVYGISGGAQMAHRIALRRPQYFSGVHIHVNSSYDIPTSGAEKVLWLVTTGESEYGYDAGKRFYNAMIDKKYYVIFKAGENLGHSDREDIQKLSIEFFKYLLTFVPDARDKNWKAPPVDKYYMMKYPVYVGDYLNHVAYRLAEAEKNIQKQNMVALPTRPLAESWGSIVDTHSPQPNKK